MCKPVEYIAEAATAATQIMNAYHLSIVKVSSALGTDAEVVWDLVKP
jgi:hypothetical protein